MGFIKILGELTGLGRPAYKIIKVKVIKTSGIFPWYKKYIGQTLNVRDYQDGDPYELINKDNPKKTTGYFLPRKDCEIENLNNFR